MAMDLSDLDVLDDDDFIESTPSNTPPSVSVSEEDEDDDNDV
jgi:hypothetical protein